MSKFLNEWCKRLTAAAAAEDLATIAKLTENIVSPDPTQNPIKLAINIDYEYVILDIVRALKQVKGLNALQIAHLLMISRCPIKNVTSLHTVDVVEHMIGLGSPVNEDPNCICVWRTSALHTAVAGGDSHLSVVQLLLKNGADLHYVDTLGFTPLHRSLEVRPCLEVLQLLVNHGAPTATHDSSGTPALITAIRNNQPLEVIQLLVQGGADVKERSVNGYTALHCAGHLMRPDLIEYLLDQGVEANTRNHQGETILYHAIRNASLELLRFMIVVCGVDLNTKTTEDNSLLHVVYGSPLFCTLATKHEYKAIADKIRFCLLSGANINAKNRYGATILQLSTMHHDNWLDVLLEHIALREFMDQPIDQSSLRMLYSNDFCTSYLVVCKRELVKLMDARFYNDVTLFDILTDNEAKMMCYVRNKELVAAFEKICQIELYQIYTETLVDRFNLFLELHRMRQMAFTVLKRTFHSVLDHVSVQEIVKKLSNWDLFKLSKFYTE